MTALAIIQARVGSQRLPGKVLKLLAGKPLIQHVIDRVRAVKGIAAVVLAVPGDEVGEFERLHPGVPVIGGSGEDVLSRYMAVLAALLAADGPIAEAVMRVTGDCPLFAPGVAGRVLEALQVEHADYASNDVTISGYPDGTDVEVFTSAALRWADAHAVDWEREHVTPAIRRMPQARIVLARSVAPWSHAPKLSVDTAEDFARVEAVMAALVDPTDYSLAATRAGWEKFTKMEEQHERRTAGRKASSTPSKTC